MCLHFLSQPPGWHVPHVLVNPCNGRGWSPFSRTCPSLRSHKNPHYGHHVFWKPCRWINKAHSFLAPLPLCEDPVVSRSHPLCFCSPILAIMALLFEFSDIANLMAVASQFAYSMVSFSVLVLRWDPATPWSGGLGSWGWWGGYPGLFHAAFWLFKRRKKWNRQPDVVWIGAAVNIAFKPLIQVPARSEFK